MVVGVSFWPYDQDSINDRQDDCEYYPDQCKDESWFRGEINNQLHQKFHLQKNFTFSFIDSWSQTAANINDDIQQEHYQQEAGILWEETTNRNSSFVFRGIDDVLEENAEMKEQIRWLEDVITNNISDLVDKMDHNTDKISDNTHMIDDNTEDIARHDQEIKTNADNIADNTRHINTHVNTCAYRDLIRFSGTITYDSIVSHTTSDNS